MTDLLKGIRALEFTQGIAGAYCGRLMADLGADVIRVETPEGDALRERGPFPPGDAQRAAGGFHAYLNRGKRAITLEPGSSNDRDAFLDIVRTVDVLVETRVRGDTPRSGFAASELLAQQPRLVVVSLSPFGISGPRAGWTGNDMVAFHCSGFAFGFPSVAVPSLELPPLNAPGHGGDFLLGEFAATATMHGLLVAHARGVGTHVDLSAQEALAAEHYHYFNLPHVSGVQLSERIVSDTPGNATISSLPCADGWIALSPREEHQWQGWLQVMGMPCWATDPRFATHAERQRHWSALHPLMAGWTRSQRRMDIVRAAEALRVPCFPFGTAPDLLASGQLASRTFFHAVDAGRGPQQLTVPARPYQVDGSPSAAPPVRAPLPNEHAAAIRREVDELLKGEPAEVRGASVPAGSAELALRPLAGVRVLDFSWVMAGPICTKYLAALGADVIKIETRTRADLSKRDLRWEQVNPGKRSLTLDMKQPAARDIARHLVQHTDIVVENFSAGVMEKFGLGFEELRATRPGIVLASSSVFGRTGPEKDRVGYGTLIQCLTGWAGMSAYPGRAPDAAGCPWTDPLVGVLETFLVLAAVWKQRRTGQGTCLDISMVETTIAALAEPILVYSMRQELAMPRGNRDPVRAPQGAYPAAGTDAWVAISVATDAQWRALCEAMGRPDLGGDVGLATLQGRTDRHDEIDEAIASWTRDRPACVVAETLQRAGISAAPTMNPGAALTDPHLQARAFYGAVPGLDHRPRWASRVPWRLDGQRPAQLGAPPNLGADTHDILKNVLGLADEEIERLAQDRILQ